MPDVVVSIEPIVREDDGWCVAADISGIASASLRLWYRSVRAPVPDNLAISHAFAVSAINQAMAVGGDLVIHGPLTPSTVSNLEEYQRVWTRWAPERFKFVRVRPSAVVPDAPFRPERGYVVPFSGGLDSAYSALVLGREGALGALVALHGIDIPLGAEAGWRATAARLSACAASLGVPLFELSTNWNEIALGRPGYLGYFLPTVAAALLLSAYGGVVIPSAFAYDQLVLPHETTPLTDPLLGRSGFPVRHHGCEAHRLDKVRAIAGWPEMLKHLRPCDSTRSDGTACRHCRKCVYTALTFAALGLPIPEGLGSVVPTPDVISKLQLSPYSTVALKDVAEAAHQRGIAEPWVAAVERLLQRQFAQSPSDLDIADLRRRLDYVLGGTDQPVLTRIQRRLARALRGRSGPRDMPGWSAHTPRRRENPDWQQTQGPRFVRSPNGRQMHVDPADQRGRALLQYGEMDPVAGRLWRQLVAAERWTHIIDVGANYGEMIVDLSLAPGTRLIAVEPNPHVCRYLAQTLRDAGQPAVILQQAISDHVGMLELVLDRSWSGLSGVVPDPEGSSGHRLEPVLVNCTTLRRLVDDDHADETKRILIKIDIEGSEVAALRGLGNAGDFADFAAMIEVRHVPKADLAWVLENFTVELFDPAVSALVAMNGTEVDELTARLSSELVHPRDVVLRVRG